jgi:cell division transport system permease protein
MRVGFFLREALRSVSRNAVPSFAALASVLVTVLVLGVFIPIVQATTGAANEVRERVIVDVYLKAGAETTDVERVRRTLTEDTPYVGNVKYVSKEEAYEAEKRRNPEAYQLLGSNPLPDTTSARCAMRSPRRTTRSSTRSRTAATTQTRSSRRRAW